MTNLTHNIIKMQLVKYGYLPNHPYHLISDIEMCDAFMNNTGCSYFYDTYPCVDESLRLEYDALVAAIQYHIGQLKSSSDDTYRLPDWVYSYMLGTVIGPKSDILDIHDMLVLMNLDNLDDIFTLTASKECLRTSTSWLRKLPPSKLDHRPPTLFGEPHVLKSLRLQSLNILSR